jgi:hypothetical protein
MMSLMTVGPSPESDPSEASPLSGERAAMDELLHRVDALPTIDPRTPDEILGYDEHGLPR